LAVIRLYNDRQAGLAVVVIDVVGGHVIRRHSSGGHTGSVPVVGIPFAVSILSAWSENDVCVLYDLFHTRCRILSYCGMILPTNKNWTLMLCSGI
jgi:hypothetical protein